MSLVTNKGWTLLILSLSDGAPLTFEQVQKALFVIQHQMPAEVRNRPELEFVPFHYGPHAPQVFDEAAALTHEGFAIIATGPTGEKTFKITRAGAKYAEAMRYDLGRDVVNYCERVVSWLRTTSPDVVYRHIIRQFPQYELASIYRAAA